jgi:hypothetical protein
MVSMSVCRLSRTYLHVFGSLDGIVLGTIAVVRDVVVIEVESMYAELLSVILVVTMGRALDAIRMPFDHRHIRNQNVRA